MKNNIHLLIIIYLFSIGFLFGQTHSHPKYTASAIDQTHFILVTQSLPIKTVSKTHTNIANHDSILHLDSVKYINTPKLFSDIYMITITHHPISLTPHAKNRKIFLFYFDSNKKECYQFNDSLSDFNMSCKISKSDIGKLISNKSYKNSPLIIFYGNMNKESVKPFYYFLKKQASYYAILNNNSNEKEFNEVLSVLPTETYVKRNNSTNINISDFESYFEDFKKIQCYLSVSTDLYKSRSISDTLFVHSDKSVKLPFTLDVKMPKLNKDIYTDSISKMFNNKEYTKAFFYIKQTKEKLKGNNIITYYKKYYEPGLEKAFNNNTTLNYLDFSEKNWHVDTMAVINYKELKTAYLKKEYKKLKSNKANNKLKLAYLKLLIKLVPGSVNYKIDFYNVKGDIAYGRKDIPSALNYYTKGYKLSHAPYRLKKIQKIITKEVQKNCESTSRNNLWENYRLFRDYSKFINTDFNLNYYAACTYYKLAYYKKSLSRYQWLFNHYNNSNTIEKALLTQKQLNNRLYDLLIKNSFYFDVCNASQTLCYNTNNPDSIAAAMQTYVASLKGVYLESIVDALQVYYVNKQPLKNLAKNLPLNSPNLVSSNVIESIFVYYPSSNKTTTIKGKGNNSINSKLKHLNSFPVTLNSLTPDSNLFFLINKLNNTPNSPLVIICYQGISNNKDESDLFTFLQNKKNTTSAWVELNTFEQKMMEKTMVSWLAFIMQNDNIQTAAISKKYWNKLSHHYRSIYTYLVIYDKNGKILHDFNYTPNRYTYDKVSWEKSKTTPLFFRQTVKGPNILGVKLIDLSVPMQMGNTNGVLKIGIKQPCD